MLDGEKRNAGRLRDTQKEGVFRCDYDGAEYRAYATIGKRPACVRMIEDNLKPPPTTTARNHGRAYRGECRRAID